MVKETVKTFKQLKEISQNDRTRFWLNFDGRMDLPIHVAVLYNTPHDELMTAIKKGQIKFFKPKK